MIWFRSAQICGYPGSVFGLGRAGEGWAITSPVTFLKEPTEDNKLNANRLCIQFIINTFSQANLSQRFCLLLDATKDFLKL
jgi:hypothetical protein